MQVMNVLLKSNLIGIKKLATDETAPVLISAFARIFLRIHENGDLQSLLLIIDRVVGSAPAGGRAADIERHVNSPAFDCGVDIEIPANGKEAKL